MSAKSDAAITSSCGSAEVTFSAPDPGADGVYYVGIFDSSGTQLYPDPACDIANPGGGGDSGAPDPCEGATTLSYGAAE